MLRYFGRPGQQQKLHSQNLFHSDCLLCENMYVKLGLATWLQVSTASDELECWAQNLGYDWLRSKPTWDICLQCILTVSLALLSTSYYFGACPSHWTWGFLRLYSWRKCVCKDSRRVDCLSGKCMIWLISTLFLSASLTEGNFLSIQRCISELDSSFDFILLYSTRQCTFGIWFTRQ